jgi:hypothetical protein
MPTINASPEKSLEQEAEEAVTKANTDLKDQGDIAADDAGATALAERVTRDAGVQGEDESAD